MRASCYVPPGAHSARARCVVAEAEIALAARDLGFDAKMLESARATLERHGDRHNAAVASSLLVQRRLLIGDVDGAERALDLDISALPPVLQATSELLVAQLAMRRVRARDARAALVRAERAARRAGIVALGAEVLAARAMLNAPVARVVGASGERSVRLDEVEKLLASRALIVDGCRRVVRCGAQTLSLVRRPVLMALAHALARAWPDDVRRDELIARVFRLELSDESHRQRLRVEIGRLRRLLDPLASIEATARGYVLKPRRVQRVVALAPPIDEPHAQVLAHGEAWSTASLAQALGASRRTLQRALATLARAGKVQAFGHGRARRWMMPSVPGFATVLLLPVSLPSL